MEGGFDAGMGASGNLLLSGAPLAEGLLVFISVIGSITSNTDCKSPVLSGLLLENKAGCCGFGAAECFQCREAGGGNPFGVLSGCRGLLCSRVCLVAAKSMPVSCASRAVPAAGGMETARSSSGRVRTALTLQRYSRYPGRCTQWPPAWTPSCAQCCAGW